MDAEEVRDALCRAVEYLGVETSLRSVRVRNVLNDLCGTRRFEISLLVDAQAAGVPAELVRNAEPLASAGLRRLAAQIVRDHQAPEEAAVWAVLAWARALGVPVIEDRVEMPLPLVESAESQEAAIYSPDLPDARRALPWGALLLPARWHGQRGRPLLALAFALGQGLWFARVAQDAYAVATGLYDRATLRTETLGLFAGAALWMVLALPGLRRAMVAREGPLERAWDVGAAWAVGAALGVVALLLPLYPVFAGAPPWWERFAEGKGAAPVHPPDGSVLAVSGDGRTFLAARGTAFSVGAFGPRFECLFLAGSLGRRTTRRICGGALSADGGEAILLLDGTGPTAFDVQAGTFSSKALPKFDAPARSCAFSADGSRLAFGLESGDVAVCDGTSWRVLTVLRGASRSRRPVVAVAVANSGRVVGFFAGYGLVGGTPDGGLRCLIASRAAQGAVAISPDATRAALAIRATLSEFQLRQDAQAPVTHRLGFAPTTLAYSKDGQSMLAVREGHADAFVSK